MALGLTNSPRPSGNLSRNSQRYYCARCGHPLACEARDDALSAHNPHDLAMAAELEALPAAPLPLPAAVSLWMGRDGYIPALAQSALLQTYGGVGVATAAQSLADDARTLLHRPEPLEAPARSRHSSPHDADAGANDAADSRARPQPLRTTRFWPPSQRIRRARMTGGATGVGVAATAAEVVEGRGAPAHDSLQAEDDDDVAPPPAPSPPPRAGRAPLLHTHLEALQALDLEAELLNRVYTSLRQLRGLLRNAFRVGLEHIRDAPTQAQASTGWKLFLLAPRMLLYRAPGAGQVPSEELRRREKAFLAGQWLDLLREAASAAQQQPRTQGRATTTQGDEEEEDLRRRAERAGALAHLGELSAAAKALTALPLAPTTRDTLNALRDPERRPPEPQVPVEPRLRHSHAAPVELSPAKLIANARRARKGATPGPSGCTSEHLRVLLDDEECTQLLTTAAEQTGPCRGPGGCRPGSSTRTHGSAHKTLRRRTSLGYGGRVQAPRGAHARAAASRRVPERLRALPVRAQHQGRRGSPGAGDTHVHRERPPDHSPECRRRGRLRPHFSTEHAVNLGGPTRAGRPPPVCCTLLRLAEHVRFFTTRKATRMTCNKAKEESRATH